MTQPTALFLADILEDAGKPADIAEKCAAELRRLYAQRLPLTEEEIDSIWDSEKAFADIYAIVRAIERAHGIT